MKRLLVLLVSVVVAVGVVVGSPPRAEAAIDPIAVDSTPMEIAFSPSGSRAYVIHWGGSLTVIDVATRTVIDTVTFPYNPCALAVHPSGTKVYIGLCYENRLLVVNTSTLGLTYVSSTGTINGIAFSADGTRAYATAGFSLVVLNGTTNAKITTLSTPTAVRGVTISPDGTRLYLGNGTNGSNATYEATISPLQLVGSWTSGPGGPPAVTHDGSRLLVGNWGTHVLDLTRAQSRGIRDGDNFNTIRIAPWGSVAYTWGGSFIRVIDVGAERVVSTIEAPGTITNLAIRPGGTEIWATVSDGTAGDLVAILPISRPTVSPSITVERVAGADRYSTAVAISQRIAPSGNVPVVYIASGQTFPDALSAAPAAVNQGGVLLLTPTNGLPNVVRAELIRLNPGRIVVAGGDGAVSPTVRAQLIAAVPTADLDVIAGANRYATSRALYDDAFPGATPDIFVATGANFPDALSVGPVAGSLGMPVLLVAERVPFSWSGNPAFTLDDATIQHLLDHSVSNVVAVGGIGVVSKNLLYSMYASGGTNEATRIWGANRYTTSENVSAYYFETATTVYLASGLNFPDALAGAVLAGSQDAPLYVVPQNCVPSTVLDDIVQLGATKVVLLGGTGMLGTGVQSLRAC